VQRRGGHLAPALASVVVDRLFDLLMLLAAALVGIAVYGAAFTAQIVAVGVLTVCSIAGIVVAALPAVRRGAGRIIPARLRLWLARMRWVAALSEAHLKGRSVAGAVGWSVASFAATLARIYLCFLALGLRLPLLTFVAVVGLSSLAGLLSVSGIGTRDWAMIALLGRQGIAHDTALAASFLILFLNLTNVVPGLFAYLREPAPSRTPPARERAESAVTLGAGR
jgi:uncharacterized protein (TIRG00374 family)